MLDKSHIPSFTIDEAEVKKLRTQQIQHTKQLIEANTKKALVELLESGKLKIEEELPRSENNKLDFAARQQDLLGLGVLGPGELAGSDGQSARAAEFQVTQFNLASGCSFYAIPSRFFKGHPEEPIEVHDEEGQGIGTPISYSASQPLQGRLEGSALVNPFSQGIDFLGFGVRIAESHLSATFLIPPQESVVVRATPLLSGRMIRGSVLMSPVNSWSAYQVVLILIVTALPSGQEQVSRIYAVDDQGKIGNSTTLDKRPFSIAVELEAVNETQMLLIDLTLGVVTANVWDGTGFAFIDMDGLSSPPGKNPLYRTGGLELSHFIISDPSCRFALPVPFAQYG